MKTNGLNFRPAQPDCVIVFDDPEVHEENGVVVSRSSWGKNLDFIVAWSDSDDVKPGDRILIDNPQAGTKLSVDGVSYRVVPLTSVIAQVCYENTPMTDP